MYEFIKDIDQNQKLWRLSGRYIITSISDLTTETMAFEADANGNRFASVWYSAVHKRSHEACLERVLEMESDED